MASVKHLVRENIQRLKPYRCARDDYSSGILLDANENSFGPCIETTYKDLNRYPDPYQVSLKQKIKDFRQLESIENIFVGTGSDESIDLLIRCFCEPQKDAILITPPTYGMYKVSADIHNVEIKCSNLNLDFQLNVSEMKQKLQTETTIKLVFLCSPGNPTGDCLNEDDILEIAHLAEKEKRFLVIVDEAYIDFASQPSFVRHLKKFNYLVVLQTLSKSFGLAGLRCGMALTSKDVIYWLNSIKSPYNLSQPVIEIAERAFSDKSLSLLKTNIEKMNREKKSLYDFFITSPIVEKILGGKDANFLLIQLKASYNALYIYKKMAEEGGIVIRYRGNELHCKNALRVTIGTESENSQLIQLFKSFY